MEILDFFVIIFFSYYIYISGKILGKFLAEKHQLFFFENFILGTSVTIIFINFTYFILNFSIENSLLILSIIIILIFIKLNQFNVKFFLEKELLIFFLGIFIFFLPAIIYGEQFYIFRGNHYDSTWYLGNAVIVKNFLYSDFLNPTNRFQIELISTLDKSLYERPGAALFLSIFLLFSKNIFLVNFLFKGMFAVLAGFSFVFLIKSYFPKLKKFEKNILVFSITFSFWVLYIFEIDALSQLIFLSYFSYLIVCFIKILKENDISQSILFSLNASAGFIFYPQQFLILFLIFALMVINYFFLLKQVSKFKNIIFFNFVTIILFFLFTSSHWESTYGDFAKTFNIASANVDWWGYYGSFIIGRENLVFNNEFINEIKDMLNNSSNLNTIIYIVKSHLDSGYYFSLVNILPSIFGYYHLTPGKSFTLVNLILLLICFYIIIYLTKNFIHNILFINKNKSESISQVFTSCIAIFVLILSINLIKYNFWQIIKLYFFFSYFFITIFFFKFEKKKKQLTLRFSKIILLSFLIFPIYKYSNYNNGIGRFDSFPSVIRADIKKNFDWKISDKKFIFCSKVEFDENLSKLEKIKKRLILIKLTNDKIWNFKTLLKKTCFFDLEDKKFKVIY